MTTIFWDGTTKTLYADSRSSRTVDVGGVSNRRRSDDKLKIVTFKEGDCAKWKRDERILAFAGAGDVPVIEFLGLHVIRHGAQTGPVIREIPHLRSLMRPGLRARLLVITEKQVVRLSFDNGSVTTNRWPVDSDKRLAIGSGAKAATIASETFQLDGEGVMRFARLADSGTGGLIERYQLVDGNRMVCLDPIARVPEAAEFNHIKSLIGGLEPRVVDESRQRFYGLNPAYEGAARECMIAEEDTDSTE